jgi:molybdopterin converting factor subunit 1
MKLLYFAWLKGLTGVDAEEVSPPDEVRDVKSLLAWQRSRGPGFAKAFDDLDAIRIAVNQTYAKPGDAVGPGDEVAFFPPVTGG